VDVSKGYGQQQPGTTPVGLNVRGYEPASKRAKGGARPGLVKYLAAQLPSGAHLIQNLNIVDPSNDSALLSNVFDWPGLPAGGVNDPVVPPVPAPPTAPITIPAFGPFPALSWQLDLTTPGFGPGRTGTVTVNGQTLTVPVPSDWGATTVGQGINSRNPGRIIPVGGSGAQPTKNKKKKLTPTIVWSNPPLAPIGTVLGATQLNATAKDPNTSASVPGTFQYTPPAGTRTTTDPQFLYVLFTPNDLTKYTINTARVTMRATGVFLQASDFLGSLGNVGAAITFQNYPSNVVAGSLLLLATTTYHRTPGPLVTVAAVTDTLGSLWTQAVTLTVTGNDGVANGPTEVALWYAVAPSSGPNTVSGTLSSDPAGFAFANLSAVLEYSGFSLLDAISTSSGAGTGGTTGAIAVAQAGELAVGAILWSNGGASGSPTTFSAAGTIRTYVSFGDGNYGAIVADVINAARPTQAVAATLGNAGYAAVGATFR
jgi:hypothetical protein